MNNMPTVDDNLLRDGIVGNIPQIALTETTPIVFDAGRNNIRRISKKKAVLWTGICGGIVPGFIFGALSFLPPLVSNDPDALIFSGILGITGGFFLLCGGITGIVSCCIPK